MLMLFSPGRARLGAVVAFWPPQSRALRSYVLLPPWLIMAAEGAVSTVVASMTAAFIAVDFVAGVSGV